MKSAKEISIEEKILRRLERSPICTKLVNYLFADDELQEFQEYSNNVSIKRLGLDTMTMGLFTCDRLLEMLLKC